MDGGGMLRQRMQAGTGEGVSKELCLRYSELALAQANCQAMGATQLQDDIGDAKHDKLSQD